MAGSALVGLGVGYLSLMLFLWMCRYPPEPVVRRMILGTLSPSAALLGMVLLFAMPVMSHGWDFVRMIVSLTLLFFPALYRLGLDGLLQDLKIQRARAQLMGASPRLIFRDVVLPQALPLCARLSAVASLWSWGDFAMSNLVVSERKTLATLVLSLLESYRFEVAALLLTPLLLGGALTFAFFVRVGNVYPSEPQS